MRSSELRELFFENAAGPSGDDVSESYKLAAVESGDQAVLAPAHTVVDQQEPSSFASFKSFGSGLIPSVTKEVPACKYCLRWTSATRAARRAADGLSGAISLAIMTGFTNGRFHFARRRSNSVDLPDPFGPASTIKFGGLVRSGNATYAAPLTNSFRRTRP